MARAGSDAAAGPPDEGLGREGRPAGAQEQAGSADEAGAQPVLPDAATGGGATAHGDPDDSYGSHRAEAEPVAVDPRTDGEPATPADGAAAPEVDPTASAGHPPVVHEREPRLRVLLYSDDPDTRAAVRLAVGRRPSRELPVVAWVECATAPAVVARADAGGLDVLVLDGEATPVGGMGLCRQLKNEIYRCPPVLVLTGRPDDAWLAAWSLADAAVPHPLDPRAVAAALADLARARLAATRAG